MNQEIHKNFDKIDWLTPLTLAVKMNNIQFCKSLLSSGSNIDARDSGVYKNTPILWAA